MISTITGTLTEATPLTATIEINGLGYLVNIPLTTAEKLPQVGSSTKLHTTVIYREDSQTLYGFATPGDRDFFRLLIDHVTGIGPKLALTIMSRLSVPTLESAIQANDTNLLSKCPGIGKKTAERLIIELRGKISATTTATPTDGNSTSTTTPTTGASSTLRDAILALTALGYKPADADTAVRRASQLLGPTATTEQLIKKTFTP